MLEATSPSRAGSPWEWPGSTAALDWGRWPTAQAGMFLRLRQPAGPGVGGQAAVSAGGPRTKTGVSRLGFRRRGRATGRRQVGIGDGAAGLGAGPSASWLGCRGRRLRDVPVLPGRSGILGDMVCPGRSGRLYGVAAGTRADWSGIPGPGGAPQTQDGGRTAAHNAGARRCNPGGGLPKAGDNGRRLKPGSAQLCVQRPAGASNQQA